ncbi:hypothetical protein NONI108955_05770 [Nocardia ninae]|uniref:Uncharacterized protein n=1 Tax=Nocardia ninae NBRC 108245 TaxID=1210091 RepID=A0A511MDZ9_9NOCA|nr:hypothetical protein [Nocardia ninae]GEM38852.1 hypothetical protein NN4_33710 [Nocardia ninae NBRC 108245]
MADTRDGGAASFDELYPALGKMLVASSRMEWRLRYLVCWLAGEDQGGWIVFEGQSVDWLVASGRAILGELRYSRRWPDENSDRIENALAEVQAIAAQRNFLVHGDWDTKCYSENCKPRLRNLPSDDRVFHVARSRYRKGFEEREVAVTDVEKLAKRMVDLAAEMDRAKVAARIAWIGR